MKDVLIIDKTAQIKSALARQDFSTLEFHDEVGGLNAVSGKEPIVVLLHQNIMEERTAYYIKLLLESNTHSKIVVIGSAIGEVEQLNCLLAGAKGYQDLDKLSVYADKLVTVIGDGEAWITRRMTATLLDSLRESNFQHTQVEA